MVIIRVNLRKAKTFLLDCFVVLCEKSYKNYKELLPAGMEMSEVRVIFVINITKELFCGNVF